MLLEILTINTLKGYFRKLAHPLASEIKMDAPPDFLSHAKAKPRYSGYSDSNQAAELWYLAPAPKLIVSRAQLSFRTHF